jgi:hypothetical protein
MIDQRQDEHKAWAPVSPVPSLEAVVAEPTLVGRLPRPVAIEYCRVTKRLVADLEAHIGTSDPAIAASAIDQDRAIGLTEASEILGMKRRTLERRSMWQQLGGYRDVDGHIKFRLVLLHRHLARRSTTRG